jgi:glycerol uptake facilitator-like aquaporin
LLYIAFAFGISLAINVAIFADVSGANFNPAVSYMFYFYTHTLSETKGYGRILYYTTSPAVV